MALREALKGRWFWYSILCVLCWGGWALLSKIGSEEIPPETMAFLFTIGTLPVAVALLIGRGFKLENSKKGIFVATINGILSALGGLTLFAAYHTGGNTSLITVSTSLYPVITVVLAVMILRERLTATQVLGLAFAGAAFVLFSL